ncbi:hypothetical protein [Rhodococcus sp. IEGM 1408]|uniref:hypothetical protein n=1 Tax=Rhodococcus sp. IEGM 1408 TaxID=3082220 RepID=UPI0029529A4C|nr:hypothetical protein [Rhodococcus sp. IEGM 1408]MDV8001341.1 hypothetical protein [Rhodococcus sp. IEGM 1408]
MSTEPTDRESPPGRFIARCATEADGGTPGMTFFTDGSQNVTDHCLSRYYIGVQPDPGALYVADEDAGTYAPSRGTESVTEDTTAQWTPAQPRTDAGALDPTLEGPDGRDPLDGDPRNDDDETDADGTEPTDSETSTPATPTDGTTPTTAPPATPGVPGTTSPEGTVPANPDQSDPAAPGSSEEPTTVPTVTEAPAPQQSAPPTSVLSTSPFESAGQGSAGSEGSHRLPPLPWPLAPRPGGSAG